MAKILMMLMVGGVLFGATAAATWVLRPVPEEDPAETVTPTSDTDKQSPVITDSSQDTLSEDIASGGITAATVLRLSQSIEKREKHLNQREAMVESEERRLKFMIDDLQRERNEISAMLEKAEDSTELARTLLERVQRSTLPAPASINPDDPARPDGTAPGESGEPMSPAEIENIRTVAVWLEGMAPEQASETIRGLSNTGKMDVAVQILNYMEERNVSKILTAFGDTALVSELIERYRKLKDTGEE